MKTRKIYVIKYFQLKVKFCTGNWLKYFIFCCKIYLIYFPISFIALFPTCRTGPHVSTAWMWVVVCTATSSSSVLLPCQAVPLTHVWTLSIRGSVLSVLSSTGLAWSAANTWSPVTAATTLQSQSMTWSWRYNYQICPGHAGYDQPKMNYYSYFTPNIFWILLLFVEKWHPSESGTKLLNCNVSRFPINCQNNFCKNW